MAEWQNRPLDPVVFIYQAALHLASILIRAQRQPARRSTDQRASAGQEPASAIWFMSLNASCMRMVSSSGYS